MPELATLARPYANAAFANAREQGTLEGWSRELTLAAALCAEPRVAAMVGDSGRSQAERAEAFAALGGETFSPPMVNFIGLLAQHKRLPLLAAIAERFEQLRAALEKMAATQVTSAQKIPDPLQKEIEAALSARLGIAVAATYALDEELIGGFKVQTGDTVLDASVRGKLNELAERLL